MEIFLLGLLIISIGVNLYITRYYKKQFKDLTERSERITNLFKRDSEEYRKKYITAELELVKRSKEIEELENKINSVESERKNTKEPVVKSTMEVTNKRTPGRKRK